MPAAPVRPFSPRNIDPVRRCLPIEHWPVADQQAWAVALEPGDVLDPGGAAAAWATNSRLAVTQSYGRFLTWLNRNQPESLGLPLVARVTPQTVKAFAAELRTLNTPLTVVLRIDSLSKAVTSMAPAND